MCYDLEEVNGNNIFLPSRIKESFFFLAEIFPEATVWEDGTYFSLQFSMSRVVFVRQSSGHGFISSELVITCGFSFARLLSQLWIWPLSYILWVRNREEGSS